MTSSFDIDSFVHADLGSLELPALLDFASNFSDRMHKNDQNDIRKVLIAKLFHIQLCCYKLPSANEQLQDEDLHGVVRSMVDDKDADTMAFKAHFTRLLPNGMSLADMQITTLQKELEHVVVIRISPLKGFLSHLYFLWYDCKHRDLIYDDLDEIKKRYPTLEQHPQTLVFK